MKISTIKDRFLLNKKNIFYNFLSFLFWIALWQMAFVLVRQEILLVSPADVFFRLSELIREPDFWFTSLSSMIRILKGFLLALTLGLILAVLTSYIEFFNKLFKPLLNIIKVTPVASFIILALVWIKSNNVPVFICFLMVLPIVWINISQGISNTDKNLLDMAKVYKFSRTKTIKKIYLPSVMPYFAAACTTGIGLSWKAAITAEIISNTKTSIGGQIYNSKIYMETVDLFAWTVTVIILSVVLEFLLVYVMNTVAKRYNLVV